MEREFYQSGGFVKGPDGRWLVYVNPAGGQRPPESGDWAEIVQRTKSFNRPVPVTLVAEVGDGAWTFRNGHHQSASWEDHPHRQYLDRLAPRTPRRPGEVPVKPQLCLTPIDNTNQVQEEPPEEDDNLPWWKRIGF